ncbi:MAG: hypothetical protein A3F68_08310 [Acidobacteria bacterium RIFCSPLOWO2_12_FULL_54_10]|nr:MAG: hypothetical protein A3F68_08310 [Acidobacteria bacterium RIFCSPLOWO2_12_FULL_54_10]
MIPPEVAATPDAATLTELAPTSIVDAKLELGELTLVIDPGQILTVCEILKARRGYAYLSDVTAVDWHPSEPRFEVVYHLFCHERKQPLRLKCRLGGDQPSIASVVPVWGAANWCEREVFDLFGIRFAGHPHLRRLLMPIDWEGHPLCKDYPVTGYR